MMFVGMMVMALGPLFALVVTTLPLVFFPSCVPLFGSHMVVSMIMVVQRPHLVVLVMIVVLRCRTHGQP